MVKTVGAYARKKQIQKCDVKFTNLLNNRIVSGMIFGRNIRTKMLCRLAKYDENTCNLFTRMTPLFLYTL